MCACSLGSATVAASTLKTRRRRRETFRGPWVAVERVSECERASLHAHFILVPPSLSVGGSLLNARLYRRAARGRGGRVGRPRPGHPVRTFVPSVACFAFCSPPSVRPFKCFIFFAGFFSAHRSRSKTPLNEGASRPPGRSSGASARACFLLHALSLSLSLGRHSRFKPHSPLPVYRAEL